MSSLARRVLEGLPALKISQGAGFGGGLRVLPWERRFVRGALAPGVRTAALSIGRGNGKSTFCAALGVAAMVGPLKSWRADIVVTASSYAQAKIIFQHARWFMAGLIQSDPRRFRVADSQNVASIEDRNSGVALRCIGSDPRRAHGLAPVLILADEPAQWELNRGERMLAALETSLGKVPNSRLLVLGTRPAESSHWFQALLDGGADYAQTHAAPRNAPPFQRRTWLRANPSLPHMPDLEDAIRSEAQKARRDPSMLARFRALRLNQGVSDVEQATLLDAETWERIEGNVDREGACTWGVDLGTSAAQSAVAAFWPTSGRLEVVSAFPTEPGLVERGHRDGVGNLYVNCARRGELLTLGGASVNIQLLVEAALERFGPPSALACDRW